MPREAVTFDFHNTIALCEEWFDLEVRRLVSAYLRWEMAETGTGVSDIALTEADARYRTLRLEIMDHGNEESAEACVAIVLGQMGLPVDEVRIGSGVELLMREALTDIRPVPGSIDSIQALHEEGVPLAIVSSAVYHPFLEWTLDDFGVRDAFAQVTTSASAGYYKGRPEIYWDAISRLEVDPKDAVHIGDSHRWDVVGAQRAGIRPVWYRTSPEAPMSDEALPHRIVDTMEGADVVLLEELRNGGDA